MRQGEPVHIQRTDHPLLTTPNALVDRRLWSRWNLRHAWAESAADNGPLPDNSPAASGVRWNISEAITSKPQPSAADVAAQWESNAATSRHANALLSHSRGLTNQVLLEFFRKRGRAVLVGLGLARRAVPEPVAALFLENLHAYLANAKPTRPHPHFEKGHKIVWGDYQSERGVAFSK